VLADDDRGEAINETMKGARRRSASGEVIDFEEKHFADCGPRECYCLLSSDAFDCALARMEK
jgi:hypothetical protein